MQANDISSDQLFSLLPNDLIEEALAYPEAQDWPWTKPPGLPEITPLESRLHCYKQVRPSAVTGAPTLRLFPLLHSQGVFTEAAQSVRNFAKSRQRLRAEAVSFTPTHFDKENVNPIRFS